MSLARRYFNFTERYMTVREWPASRKTAMFGFVLLGAQIGMWLRLRDVALEIDEPYTRALEDLAFVWMLAVAACCAAGGIASWRRRPANWLPYVLAVIYAVFIDATMQLGANVLILTWIPLASLLFAFFFDERVAATLLGSALVLAVGFNFVSIPALNFNPPMPGTAVDQAVEKLVQQLVAVLVIANFMFAAFTLSAQRVLEQKLQEANRLIRRYVPAQLADRIAAGTHEATKHERRKLTIFFSDVVGFTNQSDELDAEELAALLNEYLGEMTVIADRFGATVNQLVGDGIMIVFGAPTATDDRDHALRAVRMALAMQQRMAELRDGWFRHGVQRPFHVRIGINTGFASVGDFGSPGRMMYSAIGQQTNLAARIQAHCEPDKVLISHSTWALVQDAVACTPKGEIEVKGLHYPVLVYEVAEAVTRHAA